MTVVGLGRKTVWLLFFFFLAFFGLGVYLGRLIPSIRPRSQESGAAPAVASASDARASGDGDAAAFRLARDVELSRQYERLRGLVEGERTGAAVRQEAEEDLWRLTRVEAAEHEAETALALQGWPGATVSIVGNEATVVVRGRSLSEAEAARIGRLVAGAAGLPESAVRILEKP
ncbi:MAG: SpoIIIAH-like family protein [Firmicutes bacterium]|nr:SpoIIIAH-like family protein [Bacillota bacterium]